MLLTVIIVTKNPGNDIYPTLASLKNLDDSSVEILVKDNSSDKSLSTINDAFHFSNFRYVHQSDFGVYDAMNQALEMANGEFIYFLNAGDQYLNGSLLETLRNSDDQTGFLFGNMIFLHPFVRLVRYSRYINKYSVYLRRVCHQGIIFRKEVFDALGNFDTNLKINADYLFIVRMMDRFKGKSLNRFLAMNKGGGISYGHKPSKTEKKYLTQQMKKVFSAPELWLLSFASIIVATLVYLKNFNKPT
ncbi:glycosyltransferase [Rhodohalobacter sp. 614A]|uniref:glycosyltransferase n=1 Tax=Rhodohalobacter sp. 614A TaxID=2908649 RepID=UPI001F2A70D8|nr:glycosyltransferase [Rhodohalobacter sp. 614A]